MSNTSAAFFASSQFDVQEIDQISQRSSQTKADQLSHFLSATRQHVYQSDILDVGRTEGSETSAAPYEAKKVVTFPQFKEAPFNPKEFIYSMQEWDGYVTEIGKDTFIGMMAPVGTSFGNETERLEYAISDLNERDQEALKVGSIFRMSAGYSRKSTGNLRHTLSIYFRPAALGLSAPNQNRNRARNFFARARHARPVTDADQAFR